MQTRQPAETTPPTLVIAARGKTGRRVADRLEARGLPVRRGSRSAAPPSDARLDDTPRPDAQRSSDTRSSAVRFDWDDRATWAPALAGCSAVYVVYSPDLAVPAAPDAIRAFTELARELGVQRLVLLSGRGEEAAQRCEDIVRGSGLQWTVVRASWFAQNFDEGAFVEMVMAGEVALPADAVREPFIDVDDIADVAVAALTEDGHQGRVYEVTGPRLMTFAQAVAEIAEAAGRELRYVTLSSGAFRADLIAAGLPGPQVELLEYLFGTVLDGRNAALGDGVQRALGRPPRDFRDYARDAAARGAWAPAPQTA